MEASEGRILGEGWRLLGQPSGNDHHRFFERSSDGRLSVCDNSGRNPDFTDDGPLFIDKNRRATIYMSAAGRICFLLPVTKEDTNGEFFVGVTAKDALWLMDNGHWDMENSKIDADLIPEAELLARWKSQKNG